jgi:transporter family-2 protein
VPVARSSVYLILPLVGGALIAAQAPINAQLRTILHSPVGSAFASFAIGTVLLFLALSVVGDLPKLGSLGPGPWWA